MSFWDNLRNSVESIRDVSDQELIEAGVAPEKLHDPHYVKRTPELPGNGDVSTLTSSA